MQASARIRLQSAGGQRAFNNKKEQEPPVHDTQLMQVPGQILLFLFFLFFWRWRSRDAWEECNCTSSAEGFETCERGTIQQILPAALCSRQICLMPLYRTCLDACKIVVVCVACKAIWRERASTATATTSRFEGRCPPSSVDIMNHTPSVCPHTVSVSSKLGRRTTCGLASV